MRWKSILAALAALVCVGFANPNDAAAFGDRDQPEGWGHARPINHWVYYPRYTHNYRVDPYAYQYSPRGYYPYAHSHYSAPARVIRKRNHQHYNHWNVQAPRYKYYPYWGAHKHWNAHHHEGSDRRYHSWQY